MRLSPSMRLALRGVAAGVRLPDNKVNRYLELTHLRLLLRELEINCVLDVGANVGQFASELRVSGFEGMICSFEPVERTFSELHRRFRGDSAWRGYPIALGSRTERKTIHVDPDLTVMSSLLTARAGSQRTVEERVDVMRLDEVIDDALVSVSNPRVFLKMDTQGYDLEVFRGAGEQAGRIRGLQSSCR